MDYFEHLNEKSYNKYKTLASPREESTSRKSNLKLIVKPSKLNTINHDDKTMSTLGERRWTDTINSDFRSKKLDILHKTNSSKDFNRHISPIHRKTPDF